MLALLAFLLWAHPSLVGLPCAALLVLGPALPRAKPGWSQPIAGMIGAVSLALLVVSGGNGSRLGAATSAYIVLATSPTFVPATCRTLETGRIRTASQATMPQTQPSPM